MRKFNFSSRITSIFEKMETSYEEIKNLMFDLYYNDLGEGVTKKEAEERLRNISLEIFEKYYKFRLRFVFLPYPWQK